ncbi:MAG: hypothetical protein A3K59_03995 [Euryarchaeota archaeon RBG_19FT_COMBO_69_17]|nr:MAG: hypothetical protein A3K59_03995 [Euryarchaeota archaeon RBG_19FT_COMBO_69_17]
MRWMPRFGSRGSLAVLGAVVVLVILLVWMVLAYNALVAKETAIEAQWAEVENRYQLKVDKIPQLVAAAEGYQEFERSTLENITRLRTQWSNASTIDQWINTSNAIDQNLYSLWLTYEAYPTLFAGTLVQDLMFEISGVENEIAVARMRYNEAVQAYNTQIRSFPDMLVAGWGGFQERDYYNPPVTIPGAP